MLPATFWPRDTGIPTEKPEPDGRSQLPPQARGDRADRLFGKAIPGLTEGLRDTGHALLLASTGDSMEREEAQLRALIGWAPGALIVTGRHHTAGALRLLEPRNGS